MSQFFKPKEDLTAQKRVLEIYERLKKDWKHDRGLLDYEVGGSFILLSTGAIGICKETDKILITVHLGTSADTIFYLSTLLSDYKDRLIFSEVTVFASAEEISIGRAAVVKYSEFLLKCYSQMPLEKSFNKNFGKKGGSYGH